MPEQQLVAELIRKAILERRPGRRPVRSQQIEHGDLDQHAQAVPAVRWAHCSDLLKRPVRRVRFAANLGQRREVAACTCRRSERGTWCRQ
jgi:hypothetical protein